MDPLTLLGLGFTAATVASIVGLNLGRVTVPRSGRWVVPPRVIVTPGASVSLAEVEASVETLRGLGQPVERVIVGDPPSSEVDGAIVIRRRDRHVRPEHAGETRTRVDADGRIRSAVVLIPALDVRDDPTAQGGFVEYTAEERRVLLAHELAHACGWGHTHTALLGRNKKGKPRMGIVGRKTGHLMNPDVDAMGWSTKGMEPPR